MEAIHDYAHQYLDRGFAPVPVEFKTKSPKVNAWPDFRLKREQVLSVFQLPCNIGIILGEASGGLIDIDLDCSEAIDLAPYILPPTGMIFGRGSKPASHRIYNVPDIGRSLR